MSSTTLKSWIKSGDTPVSAKLKDLYYGLRYFQMPSIGAVYKTLYKGHQIVGTAIDWLLRVFYWTPLFQTHLVEPAKKLFLYSGMPQVLGNMELYVGKKCRISGHTTFTARNHNNNKPRLCIGDNVGIGWQTTIAVGSNVIIGDNVRIAGRAFLAGYPGHPLNAKDRALGLPDTDDQVGDIILDNDVWLGTGVTVNAGVTIGKGSVIAAGSVVTKDIPPGVLAGGVPAKVIRKITE